MYVFLQPTTDEQPRLVGHYSGVVVTYPDLASGGGAVALICCMRRMSWVGIDVETGRHRYHCRACGRMVLV